jgi:Raf kinase inhibitor-like YbhB/YbcL family protein
MSLYVKQFAAIVAVVLLSFVNFADAQEPANLTISSPAFAAGASIPAKYSCKNPEAGSPPLQWRGVPKNAKSLVLIVKDPDAPSGTFIHWVVYNLPSTLTGLAEHMPTAEKLPNGAFQGVNGTDHTGYMGPCPPSGSAPHHYRFQLSALDTKLDLKPGASADEVEHAASGHKMAAGELVGTFAR